VANVKICRGSAVLSNICAIIESRKRDCFGSASEQAASAKPRSKRWDVTRGKSRLSFREVAAMTGARLSFRREWRNPLWWDLQ
jgi:hypothetical protein